MADIRYEKTNEDESMQIAVLMGGTSPERDVSLASGKAVAGGLREANYDVIEADAALGAGQEWDRPVSADRGIGSRPPEPDGSQQGGHRKIFETVYALSTLNVDVVFIALHGVPGEDGLVQGMLDLAGLPYTGSGALSSALAMDKILSKTLFREKEILTPPGFPVKMNRDDVDGSVIERIQSSFGFPVVVKPSNGGSTVGLTIVKEEGSVTEALHRASIFSRNVLIEEYIPGREVTVSIVGGKALPVIEIHPQHGIYDYECKYTVGKSTYTVPAELPDDVAARLREIGVQAFEALGCCGFARADFRLDGENRPYCLEVNTIPGMTETSLVPKAARAAGIDFPSLVDRIVRSALEEDNV